MTKRSSISTLQSLPAVFDLRDVQIELGLAREYASQYSARWAKMGLAQPLGPRTGVFFNLLLDGEGPQNRVAEATWKLYRRPAVAAGAFALHQHGWTTQRPKRLELVVAIGRSVRTLPQIDGAVVIGRPIAWFNVVAPLCVEGVSGFLLPPPEYALADALMSKPSRGLWVPDRSDIDFDFDDADHTAEERIRTAIVALGGDVEVVDAFLSGTQSRSGFGM